MRSHCLFFLFFCNILCGQPTAGLLLNEPSAFQGYTLFGNNEITYLIDNCGLIVNSWKSKYKPGEAKYLLENGHLILAQRMDGDFDAGGVGGRFELYNWEGELIWHFEYINPDRQAHHDLAPLPNGNFLLTAWEKHTEEEARKKGRKYNGDVWSERVLELEIIGTDQANIIWEWRLWDHLIQDADPNLDNYGLIADHPGLVDINYIGPKGTTSGNWVHLNAIDYNEDLDQIVLSSRLFSEIWIIDHSTSTAQAASHEGGRYGKGGDLLYRFGNPLAYQRGTASDQRLFNQHDIRWIPKGLPQEGKLMVFNNDFEKRSSSVDIWSPPINPDGSYQLDGPNLAYGPKTVDWRYTAPGFYSNLMSGAQMLPNGHIFICEGMSGQFFEINPQKEIVWEYINPVNRNGSPVSQGGTIRFNQTFRASKYALDYPAFEGKKIIPGIPVEINPWESDCYIPTDEETPSQIHIEILGNPIRQKLEFNYRGLGRPATAHLFDLSGRIWLKEPIQDGFNRLSLSRLPSGIYLLILREGERYQSFKIVK